MSAAVHEPVDAELPGGVWLGYDELVCLDEAGAKARYGDDVYERVADDVRSRRAAWGLGQVPRTGPALRQPRPRGWAGPLAMLLYVGGPLLLAVGLWAVWLAAIVGGLLLLALCIAGMHHRRGVLLRQAVRGRWCRRCGFDLEGSACGLPAVVARGVDPGPSRCPECGLPWPLVPPRR